jgi:hypothetical protein
LEKWCAACRMCGAGALPEALYLGGTRGVALLECASMAEVRVAGGGSRRGLSGVLAVCWVLFEFPLVGWITQMGWDGIRARVN